MRKSDSISFWVKFHRSLYWFPHYLDAATTSSSLWAHCTLRNTFSCSFSLSPAVTVIASSPVHICIHTPWEASLNMQHARWSAIHQLHSFSWLHILSANNSYAKIAPVNIESLLLLLLLVCLFFYIFPFIISFSFFYTFPLRCVRSHLPHSPPLIPLEHVRHSLKAPTFNQLALSATSLFSRLSSLFSPHFSCQWGEYVMHTSRHIVK